MIPKAAASPIELVQRALAACQALLDRRYTVEVEPNTVLRRNPFRQRTATPASTLWVRGSQFVQIFDSPVGKLVWGRDVEGIPSLPAGLSSDILLLITAKTRAGDQW